MSAASSSEGGSLIRAIAAKRRIKRKQQQPQNHYCVSARTENHIDDAVDYVHMCEESTRLWVQRFVYGQGMCPWSGSSLIGDRMKVRMLPFGPDDQSLIKLSEEIMQECDDLKVHNKNGMATTLLVLPKFEAFEDFLDLVAIVEGLLEEFQLDSFIQLAHFHPKYMFEDSEDDSVENYTNRSPFPTLHLIQVAEVSKAISSCKDGDTSFVWKNNIKTVKKLGKAKLDAMIRQILEDAKKTSTKSGKEHQGQ
jgi:hypothetical protein